LEKQDLEKPQLQVIAVTDYRTAATKILTSRPKTGGRVFP
jgi:hypothetical protein